MESTIESFRDRISTVNEEGKRKWIYPKKPVGKFYEYRKFVSYVLLAFLFSGPFIRINGEPLLLINIIERKFVIFGSVFWPQDFYIFLLAMLVGVVFIILFTVVYGRLFCGWVCPQTIFMEMVFRRIEYWIEGDWKHQQALTKMPWNKQKILKRGGKHLIFFGISFLIANTFLAYIIGSDQLFKMIKDGPIIHIGSFLALTIFTFVFYWVFSFFREQVCTNVCPYGRLQGVLIDKESVVVAYDYVRGEGRAKFRKNEDRKKAGKGDCIDCGHCVDVCPTGIDIRNGTQLECINCTACIDACNAMMRNVGMEENLIRYDSEKGISERVKFTLSNRAKAYTVLLLILLGVFFTMLFTRKEVKFTILRTAGSMYTKMEGDRFSNMYNFQAINKTNQDKDLELELIAPKGELKWIGSKPNLKAQQEVKGVFLIILDKETVINMGQTIVLKALIDGKPAETIETKFVSPYLK